MRSKGSSSSEKSGDGFQRKGGPDNQVVVLREAAATDLDPWSAGLCYSHRRRTTLLIVNIPQHNFAVSEVYDVVKFHIDLFHHQFCDFHCEDSRT